MSQSPDGDFFDPEDVRIVNFSSMASSHSPLTGIFLIRSFAIQADRKSRCGCHSPLTGIFLIRSTLPTGYKAVGTGSQSPDGDFFDPESARQQTGVAGVK